MVVAQLAERSLPTLEVYSSNQFKSKFYTEHVLTVNSWRDENKESGYGQFLEHSDSSKNESWIYRNHWDIKVECIILPSIFASKYYTMAYWVNK